MLELDPHGASGRHDVAARVEERTGGAGRSSVTLDRPPDHDETFTDEDVAVPVCGKGAEKPDPAVEQRSRRVAGAVQGTPDGGGMHDAVGGIPLEG